MDSFAGGGGTSTGIEFATGRIVNIAINHDEDAILMHKTNHPYTRHYQASVWDVDPVEVCGGNPVGLLWASPDCKHFSKAKGGKPVEKKIRGLAWIVLRWAGTVRPRVIMLENVEEFQTWGPVRKGKPIKSKSGQTFMKFLQQLRGLGYNVEWRELIAADYGAPTTRKRFFLVARCDGRPIMWPEPTHAPAGSPEVLSGKKLPWRSAAEIIDWSLPCPSIFDTRGEIKKKYGMNAQRPLRPNTMRRVARGVDRFVIKCAEPFIVSVNHAGEFRGQAIGEPLQTVTAKHGYGVSVPLMCPVTITNTTGSAGAPTSEPEHTVTSTGNQLLAPAVMAPFTMHNNENAVGTALTDPVNTITGSGAGGHQMLIMPVLSALGKTGSRTELAESVMESAHTLVSKAEERVVCPSLIQYHTEQSEQMRGQPVTEALMTVDAANRYGLAAVSMVKYYGTAKHGQSVRDPLHTVTAKDRECMTLASLSKFYGGVVGASLSDPAPTITAIDHNALQTAHLVKLKGTNLGGSVEEPLQTVTAGGTHHGLVTTKIVKVESVADLQNWPRIREILNLYCGYSLKETEVILFCFDGAWWFMADIGLRMLSPRELYRANGFPEDYQIERDYTGKVYGKVKQVARCGNAVPPPFATALVRANFPEWCDRQLTTMAELKEAVAV